MSDGNGTGAGLVFQARDDMKKLVAVFEPVDVMKPIDAHWLRRKLEDEGYADLFIIPDSLGLAVEKYNAATAFALTVAERRDGTFSLVVDEDLMTVRMTVTPAYGGKAITRNDIYQALRKNGIVFGILDEAIETSLTKGYARNKLIAEGLRPVKGSDGELLSLIREAEGSCPHYDDTETIDYRDFGAILSVKQGEPLMRRVPPGKGTPGMTVRGCEVEPPMGTDVQFSTVLKGVAVSPDDPDLLLAAISGQPVLVTNGVNVEPIITIKNVDLSTGNLDFDGSLKITGDVKPGMRIKAMGDIYIQGVVEAATVEASGDIEIRGGIIGQDEVRNQEGDLNPGVAEIRANGSVRALFVENALVTANVDILVHEFVINSELNAGARLMVGEPGSSKGRIISAICRARERVAAITVGSRAGVCTTIEIGVDPATRDKLAAVRHLLEVKEKELQETVKALEYLHKNPCRNAVTMLKEKHDAYLRLQTEVQELEGRKKRLQKRIKPVEDAGIVVERKVYSGVRIKIGERLLELADDLENVTFRSGEEGITY